jgi:hypothetical protein
MKIAENKIAHRLGMIPPSVMKSTKLVGGFNPIEKYEFVNGKDDIPYMKWKRKYMFETTKQIAIMFHKHKPIVFTHRFLQWVNFKDDLGVPSYLASNLHWDHDSIPLKNNLVNVYSLRTGKLPLLAIEIVDIPIKNGDLPNYL